MDKHTFLYKIFGRLHTFQRAATKRLDDVMKNQSSRLEAKKFAALHVKHNGKQVVDRSLKAKIKNYCKERFGDSAYWPWLAVYSEIKGEFKEGWIPYDYYRFQLIPKWNTGPRLSAFKTYDYKLFPEFSVKPYFMKISGTFFDSELNRVEDNEVNDFFKNLDREVVIKNDEGSGGKSIKFIHSSLFNMDDLKSIDNVLLQPVVKQYAELGELYPQSVNTLRVMTHLQGNGEIVKKFAILRFGIGGNRVDNLTTGGGFVPLTDDGKAGQYAYDINGFNLGETHPETGLKYNTIKVPSFLKAIKLCKEYHYKFPYQRLISWDICIDERKDPKLIEWNTGNQYFFVPEAILGPLWPNKIK